MEFHHLRDRAIAELLGTSRLRRSEVVALDMDDVELERRLMRVAGKDGRERVILINAVALAALREYVAVRPVTSDPAFFVTRHGTRLTSVDAAARFAVSPADAAVAALQIAMNVPLEQGRLPYDETAVLDRARER